MTPRDPLDRGTAGPDWSAAQIARADNLNTAPPLTLDQALANALPAIRAAVARRNAK